MAKEVVPFNRRENEFFIQLLLMRNNLYSNADDVKERLKDFPGDWRDLKLILKLGEKIQNHLSSTIPSDKLVRYKQLVEIGRYTLEFPGASPKGRYKLMDVDDLSHLAEAAIKGQCGLCMAEGRDVKRCPLREALLVVAPPAKISAVGCEYRHVAGDLEAGREVAI